MTATRAVSWALIAAPLGIGLVAPAFVTGHYNRSLLNLSLIHVLLVLGFNFTFGYTGQLSLGHIGFFGIGAYASGLLTADARVAPAIALLAGVSISALSALILAGLTTRLHSHYLALATLGFGQIVQAILLNWQDVTHGARGVLQIPPLAIGVLMAKDDSQVYYVILAVTVVGALFAWRFQSSSLGRAAMLMKQSEVAAESVGIATLKLKIGALVISAIYGSVAGSLYAHSYAFISPDVFSFSLMITVLAMLVLGGQGTITGAILGAVTLTFLPEWLRDFGRYWLLAYGIGILLMVVYMPSGAVGIASAVSRRLSAGVGKRRRLRDAQGAPPGVRDEAETDR